MPAPTVRKAVLPWVIGGLLLGLTQTLAVYLKKPLGVSTQFVVAEGIALHKMAPRYAQDHPIIKSEKYQTLSYGWWLDVGLIAGAIIAAAAVGRWKPSINTAWWKANHRGAGGRLIVCFIGGFFILLGARLAHGCTSGQFASGWAQLSLSVVPFTIGLFGVGMLAARIFYPKTPDIE